MLFDREADSGGPFFMDRYETTFADWSAYLDDRGAPVERRWQALGNGAVPRSLQRHRPMTRVTLEDARSFARWRFCRLPRLDEWVHAATDGGRYPYPWGARAATTWANTAELGIGAPTFVGTFESGRLGTGPYDLVGNVGEWTETPDPDWFGTGAPLLDFRSARRLLAGLPGTSGPSVPAGAEPSARLYPAWWLVAVRSASVARVVAGWSFNQRPQRPGPAEGWAGLPGWRRLPGDWSDDVGLRLAVDPLTLLQGLLRFPGPVPAGARTYLRRFLELPGHRAVLREAWARLPADAGAGPLAPLLVAEIDP